VASWAAAFAVPALGPLPGVLARGTIVVVAFPALLVVMGFFGHAELTRVRRLIRSFRPGAARSDVAAQAAAGYAVAELEPTVVTGDPPETASRP
jgi:hypothetical protein